MFVTQQQKISESERLVTDWVTKIGFLGTSFYPKSVKKGVLAGNLNEAFLHSILGIFDDFFNSGSVYRRNAFFNTITKFQNPGLGYVPDPSLITMHDKSFF